MAIEILMPALSPTMEEGKLVKWLKKEGEQVQAGDVLAEIETDKAIMEFEAVDEGVLTKILVPASVSPIKVNTPIALLSAEEQAENIAENIIVNLPASSLVDDKVERAQSIAVPHEAEAGPLITVREALTQALAEEMRRDDAVFLMGEEVAQYQGAYKISQGLLEEFGDKRVVDTPITEYGFAGIGVGAAFAGLRPVIEFMTFNFAMQAIDHIINSAAKTRYMSGGQIETPIVFRGPNGAASRVGAQHSQCYASWYSHIPGLKVVMPYTAADAKGLLKSAIRDNNPVIFLENELLYGQKFSAPESEDDVVPIGKASIYKSGRDVTIVSFGIGMHYVTQAMPEIARLGIDAEIIDLRTIRPMDMPAIIDSVKKTGRLITVEEGFPQCSVGEHIATRVMQEAFDYLDAPVLTIAGKDVPMPYAANLEKLALPNVAEIIDAVKAVTYTG